MKKLIWMLVIGASGGSMSAQPSEPAPQSARQALIEMFFDKTPGTFAKHLPAAPSAHWISRGRRRSYSSIRCWLANCTPPANRLKPSRPVLSF